MKLLNIIAVLMTCFAMQGCGRFSDGQSIWAEGLWIIPLLVFLGGCAFIYVAWRASKSGTTQQTLTGGTKDVTGKIPIHKLWKFRLGVILIIITIVIMLIQRGER